MAEPVLLIDDQKIARAGIASLLDGTAFYIAGEAELPEHGLALLEQKPFSLVIMEARLNGRDSMPCLQRIKIEHPNVPVLVFSAYENPIQISQSNMLGAAGFLRKDAALAELLEACRSVLAGESLWTSEMLRRVNVSVSSLRIGNEIEVQLTSREIQVLGLLCDGATNKEIASSLEISYETVKEHVQNVLKKVCVSDRTQAAVWAVRQGIV